MGAESDPYYCHYMAWRLGVWSDDSIFNRVDSLIANAAKLPNWQHEKSLILSCEFADFWSLIWQLQIAEYLVKVGTDVQWNKDGPDLSTVIAGEICHVECFVPKKSFGILEYIRELLLQIDSSINVSYTPCLQFSLPKNQNAAMFIDNVLETFVDGDALHAAKRDARNAFPVIMYEDSDSSLQIYYEGDDTANYVPGRINTAVGNPVDYLDVVLKEAITAKDSSNKLSEHHPNIVAVNFLLSQDYQLALASGQTDDYNPVIYEGENIDFLATAAIGITKSVSADDFWVIKNNGLSSKLVRRFANR